MRYGNCFRGLVLLASIAGAAASQATVTPDSLSVFCRMDSTSDVVKTLKKGNAVVVEMSIRGEDGEWCSIREPDRTARLGYVRCESLTRPPKPKPPEPAPQPAAPAQAAPSPRAPGGGLLDRWERRQITFGELRWLGEAMNYALVFRFSQQQKVRVVQLARETGILSCAGETDSYTRKGELPPDILSSAPRTQCDWIYQNFMERVLALVSYEQQAAHPGEYAERRRQIMGGRENLIRRFQR